MPPAPADDRSPARWQPVAGRRYTAYIPARRARAMTPLPSDTAGKADRLLAVLRACADGVAVAFSGGIDSTVVAKAACLALGDRAVAVTADSPSVPRSELADARRLAALIGIRHEVIRTDEFDNPDYLRNDGSPLLPLQERAVRPDPRPAAGSRRRRRVQRGQPRRPGRLPPGPDRRRRAARPAPAAGGRVHQGRCPGAGARPGACRPGTSRPRRACRAGWPRGWRSPPSGRPASRPPRRT